MTPSAIQHQHWSFAPSPNRAMTQVQRGGAFAVLDLMQIGVVLTDAAGLILFANQAADALLQAGDGLTVKAGHLAAMRDSASAQLQRLISEAARAGRDRAPAYLMLPRTVERPLSAAVVPIRTNEPSSRIGRAHV